MVSHKSHVLLYLNGISMCIDHLDMIWNIQNLVLWREPGNKSSIVSDDSKYWLSILRKSEQQFKIQSHFIIFDPVIVEGNDMMNQHHRLLNIYVNYLEWFDSFIQWNHG